MNVLFKNSTPTLSPIVYTVVYNLFWKKYVYVIITIIFLAIIEVN